MPQTSKEMLINMKSKKYFDIVFGLSENAPYAKKIIVDIENNFPDAVPDNRGTKQHQQPDFVFRINGHNFFRITKSCSIDFFLKNGASYDLINQCSEKSSHSHNISGSSFKKLSLSEYKIILDHIGVSYHIVKNKYKKN